MLRFFSPPSHDFDPEANVIQIPVTLTNEDTELSTEFILDTGASYTVIDEGVAEYLQIDRRWAQTLYLTNAGGTQTAQLIRLPEINVMGHRQQNSPALITQLPEETGATGLLGLSFLKAYKLIVSFRRGKLWLR